MLHSSMNRGHRSADGRSVLRSSCLILLLLLTVGCSNVSHGPAQNEFDGLTASPAYLLTIDLAGSSATREELEERHGATVLVWKPGKFAVLGLAEAPNCGECGPALAAASGVEPNDRSFVSGGRVVDMNGSSTIWSGGQSTIWSGGQSTIWSGGQSTIWSGGQSTIWSGGEFSWMPENTGLWRQVGLERGHALAANLGYGVKVAIIDTGVDLVHPALREALAPQDEWRDFYGDDSWPAEEGDFDVDVGYGHGTNVAGVVRQVAPRATILPLRVLGPQGQGEAADLVAAIVWAVDNGADVINLSLGSANRLRAVDAALDYAAEQGVFVVSSTGGTENGDRKVTYPASRSHIGREAPFLLSVTSVGPDDVKSTFATYHHTKVEMAAPGENVYGPAPEGRQAPWSGTSMSAPMAAGALALALGEALASDDGGLPEELKATAKDIYAEGMNDDYLGQLGEGRLDIAAFLRQVVDTTDSED